MLDTEKHKTRIKAKEQTIRLKWQGFQLLIWIFILARSINAVIHRLRIIRQEDIESDIVIVESPNGLEFIGRANSLKIIRTELMAAQLFKRSKLNRGISRAIICLGLIFVGHHSHNGGIGVLLG